MPMPCPLLRVRFAMVLAVAISNGNAPTTGDHDAAAAMRSPMLLNYGASTPPPPLDEAEHLLLVDVPQQQAHCCLGEGELPTLTLCGRKADRVDWASVRRTCKEWIANPMNMALLLFLLCVAVSGGMLVLLLLGLLDGAFPAAEERNHWIEINNQVLNGLFTLLSLYQHPSLCHDIFLLCRWRPRDAAELRAAYCKDAAPRRRDRLHMAVVVALLHLTVVCQYVLCGLYWGYTRRARPELLEDGFFVLGVVAPVAAAVYAVSSPLGKDAQCQDLSFSLYDEAASETKPAGHVVLEPDWAGGMFDCGGGASCTGWCLSLSCTFCVFGWNMERLGFGNAYVHAVTFALLCFAPIWILGVSALHIHDVVIGDMVGGAGVLLCACGLLYGGYWRIQMRTRFGLPGSTACCGSTSLTDYARWLLCWPCALAQEVRTASLYHVDGEVFYSKVADDDHEDTKRPSLLVVSHDHNVFRATEAVSGVVSQGSPPLPNDHMVVVVHDETTTMAPPPVQVVVVQQVEEDHKTQECSVDLHGETGNSSILASSTVRGEDAGALLESNRAMAEDDDHSMSSDGSWRVEKVKKLINMVTVVSLLILLYTRGIIL